MNAESQRRQRSNRSSSSGPRTPQSSRRPTPSGTTATGSAGRNASQRGESVPLRHDPTVHRNQQAYSGGTARRPVRRKQDDMNMNPRSQHSRTSPLPGQSYNDPLSTNTTRSGLGTSTYNADYRAPTQPMDFDTRSTTNSEFHINAPMHYGTSMDDSILPSSVQEKVGGWERLKRGASSFISTATFGHFGNNTNMRFENSRFDIGAESNNYKARQEDLRCSGLIVSQKEVPTHEHINGVTMRWTLPEPDFCKITKLMITIMSDSAKVFEESLRASSTMKTIPEKTLYCGTKYKFQITSIAKQPDGTPRKVSTKWEPFVTLPGRPENITLKCDDEQWASVQWSTCKGAEKFAIYIFDLPTSVKSLDTEETLGTQFTCRFKIDSSREIHLGREYYIQVVAFREGWESQSIRKKCFLGESESPKSVWATRIEGTNKVALSWERPGFTIFSYKYIVQVVPENGNTKEMNETTSTSMEITELKRGMSYHFRVATTGKDRRMWSTSNRIKTDECKIKVEKFWLEENSKDSANSLDCVWDHAEKATGYKIRFKCGDKVSMIKVGGESTRYTIRDLMPNTEYKASIKAADSGGGYGAYTNEETRRTGFGEPTDAFLEVFNGNNIEVTFTEAPGASTHKITLSDHMGEEKSISVRSGRNPESFKDLAHNTEYRATVTAFYDEAEGGAAQTEAVRTAPQPPRVSDITSIPEEDHLDSAFMLDVVVDDNCTECKAWIKCNDRGDEENTINMEVDAAKKRAILRYKCFYKGAMYLVKVQTMNSGGCSEWSEQKLVTTAPRKIDDFEIFLEGGKLAAKWTNPRHSTSNTITIFQSGQLLRTVHEMQSPFISSEDVEHGLEYFCQIYAENDAGCGKRATSNTILTPLDPPRKLTMRDDITHATFTWEPSTGMRAALIRFSNQQFDETEDLITGNQWVSPYVTHGEVYQFTIWARNGKAASEQFLTRNYVTAPSDVIVRRNPLEPETSLDVDIATQYTGPFRLTWREASSENKASAEISERFFTVENLKPATVYVVNAACIYGENQQRFSAKCYSEEIMTLPDKVTGLRCVSQPTGYKEIVWDGCGNDSVQYTITWSKDNTFYKPRTTYKTCYEFKHLKSGSYIFQVSAGGGKKSDECFVIIPDVPQLEVEVLSYKSVRVVFSPNILADRHALILLGDSAEESFETTEREFVIDETKFAFKKGVKYTVVAKACWKDHDSLATREEFVTGLEDPAELICELNHYDIHRPVKFTWKNSREMFAAKIQLRRPDNRLIVEETTGNSCWEYWGLKPNTTYEMFLWPGDGRRFFYDDCHRHKFTTAPTAPTSISCKSSGADPQSAFDVTIVSDYSGPFLTQVMKMNNEIVTTHIGWKKSFSIAKLSPGTEYLICSQCVFGDFISGKTFAGGDPDSSAYRRG